MSTILAIDLGKFKSVACVYQPQTGEHTCDTIPMTSAAMHDPIVDVSPAHVVIEVAWLMRRFNPPLREAFDRVCHGSRTRRKIAVVATARKLLVICWAMQPMIAAEVVAPGRA